MRTRSLVVGAAVAAAALAFPTTGRAAPTCTIAAPCDRIVQEPMATATFHQFDGAVESLEATLRAIEALAPDHIEILNIGTSFGGRPIWVARVTDERVTGAKKQVAISLSVHGQESAGREGGLRYLEDLARWVTDDPTHLLYAGDTGMKVRDVLAATETYVGFLNPDGWAAGDVDADLLGGPLFKRANDNGADLNRDFPTMGWLDTSRGRGEALSEPEARAWHDLVANLPNLTTATDIHGELTSVNNAFSDLMWPAGQWTPKRQAQELQLAKHMIRTVERKFEEDGVVLQELFGPAIGMRPANVATAYDVVGYDDSGFMGDWFVKEGAVEIDVENFLSHTAPNNAWVGALEQAHVAAVRGNMEAVIVEALLTRSVKPKLSIGRVAYFDDGTPRLGYFADLAKAAGRSIAAITSFRDIARFDSVVVSAAQHGADDLARLREFARRGGQVVLTDEAVSLVDDLGLVGTTDLTLQHTNAGHVDFGALDHRWEKGLYGTPSQTYFEVPLGYPATDSAPHHGVEQGAWEAAGGVTVGTVDDGNVVATVLGERRLGRGSIAVFGAILPQAETTTYQPHGVADYAVTIAGGHVLHRMLGFTR